MADDTTTPNAQQVQAERVIPASPEAIFAVLVDPAQHAAIDGSGSVKAPRGATTDTLQLGTRFGMDMRLGVPYRITNTVVEYEENRLIAWRHAGGHVWRYELEPVEGGTRVVETFDYSTNRAPFLLEVFRVPGRNRKAMVETLARLEALVTGQAAT